MLSGEILVGSPLSVVLLPPPSLIEFCRTMAAIATLANQQNIDDDDIFLGNSILKIRWKPDPNPNSHQWRFVFSVSFWICFMFCHFDFCIHLSFDQKPLETFTYTRYHTLAVSFPYWHTKHTHTNIIRFCEMYQIKDADYSFVLFFKLPRLPTISSTSSTLFFTQYTRFVTVGFFFFCGCTLPRVALGFCFWNHWDK